MGDPTTDPRVNFELEASLESERRHLEMMAATLAAGMATTPDLYNPVEKSIAECSTRIAREIQDEVRR